MTEEATPGHVGIGPALALVDAVRGNDLGQIHLLHHVLGNSALAISATELIRRMLVVSDTIEDLDGLEELHEIAHGKWSYSDIGVRSADRRVPYTLPLRYARGFSCSILTWHMGGCYVDEDGNDIARAALTVEVPIGALSRQRAWALGVAYSTTLLAELIADFEDVDLDSRIDAYRAFAASESLRLPG
jgi:hypothetical protein